MKEEFSKFNYYKNSIILSILCFIYYFMYIIYGDFFHNFALIADDAYYYFIIARNIASHGVSTFDGQSLTNGYHPLWMIVLVFQYLTLGRSIYISSTIEILFVSGALYLLLVSLGSRGIAFSGLFSAIFILFIKEMVATGMEASVWIFCFSLLVFLSQRPTLDGFLRASEIGIAMVLCIAARLDSVVFVVPFGLLVLRSLRNRMTALAIVAIAAVLYATANDIVFGMPFPLSGAVKSLGGFQINYRFLAELAVWREDRRLWMLPVHFWQMKYWIAVAFLCLTPVLLWRAPRPALGRNLLIAYGIGFLLYTIKLVLFSSWFVWPWYNYPIVMGLAATYPQLFDLGVRVTKNLAPSLRQAGTILAGALLVLCLAAAFPRLPPAFARFDSINRLAVTQYGKILKGDRIAMGDRAGSMAYFYPGPVTQLEGLVNDQQYFRTLASDGNVQGLLCARGVRYFLSYAVDLGKYREADIKILRPHLTQFSGPSIRVLRDEEIGRLFDLTKFNEPASGENYLYIWRLGCPPQSAPIGHGGDSKTPTPL